MQTQILKCYRDYYPKFTMRQISAHTGIQLTRLFRIYNGYEMKLKEYEIFENALKQKGAESPHEFQRTIDLAKEIFSKDTIEDLKIYIERKIETHKQLNSDCNTEIPWRIA